MFWSRLNHYRCRLDQREFKGALCYVASAGLTRRTSMG
jgi:hypothetical protein